MADESDGGRKPKKRGWGCAIAALLFLAVVVIIGETAPKPDESAGAEPSTPSAEDLAAVRGWYDRVVQTPANCDQATGALGDQFTALGSGGGDLYAGYDAARAAEKACTGAWRAFGEIAIPAAFTGEAHDKAEEALDTCEMAYFLRGEAAKKAQGIFDGDFRPSAVQSLREDLDAGNNGMFACLAQAMDATMKAGLSAEDLGKAPE